MTIDKEQVRRDADSQIQKNLRILKLAREDQGWALSRILLAERLEREVASVPALVEALIGEIARQMWLRDNYEDDSAWDDDHLLAATYAEYEARARAVSVDHLTVYEQSQGNR